MKWQLTITKADNGFILEHGDETEEGIVEHQEVFQEKEGNYEDENEAERDCALDMLQRVQEYFGQSYSKHNRKNIIIKVEERKVE